MLFLSFLFVGWMMSKQVTVTVCRFSELSAAAKDRARQSIQEIFGYPWADEALASLKALAEWFGGKMVNYEVDFFACSYSSAKFVMPGDEDDEIPADEIESRLVSLGSYDAETLRGDGEFVLTGYCSDEDAIDGFRRAWFGGERDLSKLIQAAFSSWLKACQADCAWRYEDDQVSEDCDANDYWFTRSGAIAARAGGDA